MTGLWLMIVALGSATLAWSIFVMRASRVSSAKVARFIADTRTTAATPNTHAARIEAAAERIDRARVDMEGAGEKLGEKLDAWGRNLERTVRELEALPQAPPDRPPVAFADATLRRLPNRSPRGEGTQRDPRDTLGFRWDQPVTFVVPTVRVPQTSTTSARWAVSTEDMLAVQAVDKRLSLRWPQAQIKTRIADGSDKRGPPQGNICAVCRDRRNPVTAALLDHEKTRQLFGFKMSFKATLENGAGDPVEWGITFGEGDPWISPSYQERRDLADQAPTDGTTVLKDIALLASFPSPWGSGHALVIAGIRAFGTWGAAEYLSDHFDDIYRRTDGRSFACLLCVQATYQFYPVEADATGELLLLIAEDQTPVIKELDFREAA